MPCRAFGAGQAGALDARRDAEGGFVTMAAMRLVLKYAGQFRRDQLMYWLRTGAWWIPAIVVVLALAAVLALTTQVVVPHAVYVFF